MAQSKVRWLVHYTSVSCNDNLLRFSVKQVINTLLLSIFLIRTRMQMLRKPSTISSKKTNCNGILIYLSRSQRKTKHRRMQLHFFIYQSQSTMTWKKVINKCLSLGTRGKRSRAARRLMAQCYRRFSKVSWKGWPWPTAHTNRICVFAGGDIRATGW